ncbi:hypothetical protein HDV05_003591 [Chytridiales sp. JEL 0842]|nr:hypothetical protein HDV05_003591 [Chytridiales sp. JEL 0842]
MIKTVFAGKPLAAAARPASKAVRAGAVKAAVTGGQISLRTPFTPTTQTPLSQRRHYASKAPVTILSQDADVTVPPDQSKYLKDRATYDETSSKNLAYLLIGSYGFVQASALKNIVSDVLVSLSASADVLAMAKVEVDLDAIPEGKNVVIKWRGKPVFIRHRTAEEIAEANSVALSELRHAENDADRVKQPEWLVMLGVCTHLGCVPIGDAGEYNGWFCPCHGSHYDISGRIRKGPAPLNLEIPPYDINGSTLVIG